MLNALVSSLLGEVKIEIPWGSFAALPLDVVHAFMSGDSAPLRAHVAEALDETVKFDADKALGKLAESEKEAAAVMLVDKVAGVVGASIKSGDTHAHTLPAARKLAATVVSTQEEADAVLGMGPIWRATHPAMVAAAKAYGG